MLIALFLSLLLLNPFAPGARAEIVLPSLPHILDQMELRRGVWMGLQADLTLQFSGENYSASCQGKLTYNRLREKVTLDCTNLKNDLLFSYKTMDDHFELSLPGQHKVIRGNIFDLQFDPDVSVHLMPQDLYRALKPTLIDLREARLKSWDGETFRLSVLKRTENHASYLGRTLVVTKQGDVPEETFYTPDGTPNILIKRRDFMEIKMADIKNKIFYPRTTEIQSLTTPHKTTLIIRSAKFYLNPPEWPDKEPVKSHKVESHKIIFS